MKTTDFRGAEPRMRLEDFFAGRCQAWGIFQDRFGNVRRQFSVRITGEWDAGSGRLRLTEEFHYDDGAEETRVWDIRKLDDTRYSATTDDLVGRADIRAHGNAVNLNYRMQLPIGGRTWALDFDDWMFRQDDDVVINRALVKKWGIQLGTATIFFKKDASERLSRRGTSGGARMPRKPEAESRQAAE